MDIKMYKRLEYYARYRRCLSTKKTKVIKNQAENSLQEKIVALCRHRGFIFPGSELYGGLANSFEYGPLGTLMKRNIQNKWWYEFVQKRIDCVGLDSSVLMNSNVWKASGHVDNFTDPMTVCTNCNTRVRVDQLLEGSSLKSIDPSQISSLSITEMDVLIKEEAIACPNCGKTHSFQPTKQFNLLFRTNIGATEDTCDWIYLRPETAQGAYINFSTVQTTMRKKLPFGIGQIGKSFRNEISPGHFLFRTREFEQMELQYFTKPQDSEEWYRYWVQECTNFLLKYGLKEENIRHHEHVGDELAHYAKATTDLQYKYPFGWSELWGIANRTDYDLKKHMDASGKSLLYQDVSTSDDPSASTVVDSYLPHVIEPALGVGRLLLAMLLDAYVEEDVLGRKRTVLKLHPEIAPYRFAVLPLVKKPELLSLAEKLTSELGASGNAVDYDVAGSIGRRYRRQDEIGTPLCVTVDFESLDDDSVTIRDRDSMEQKRVSISEILHFVKPTEPTFNSIGK